MKCRSGQATHRLDRTAERIGDQVKMSPVDKDDRTRRGDGYLYVEIGLKDHPRTADLTRSVDFQSWHQTDEGVRLRPRTPGDLLTDVDQVVVSYLDEQQRLRVGCAESRSDFGIGRTSPDSPTFTSRRFGWQILRSRFELIS